MSSSRTQAATGAAPAYTRPPERETDVKTGIHPEYYQAKVVCSCGNTYTTGSTKPELKVEICSQCHPFFTGEQRIVDTEGRVERLRRRFNLEQ